MVKTVNFHLVKELRCHIMQPEKNVFKDFFSLLLKLS